MKTKNIIKTGLVVAGLGALAFGAKKVADDHKLMKTQEELVAYIRLVGDGHSVIFVQDLLVRPDHQRQGIGTKLLEEALATFPNVYQRLLATDRSEKNLAFYQSLGFVELSEQACTGMIYNN